MYFGSDNQTGASEPVLNRMLSANSGYTHGYGDDEWTERACTLLRQVFECDATIFFVATGTASNSLALSCMVQPWEMVLCHGNAHILADESTAPEHFTGGARLKGISDDGGKLTTAQLAHYFASAGTDAPHNPRATALSLTQISEAGLVYSPDEIAQLCAAAKDQGLTVHMDGARFANALAATQCSPADMTWRAGIDVLSLGATKCGALCAEAVIFFNKDLAASFQHRRKRSGHLLSKGRLFGAQFVGWLENAHWLELAQHANRQALALANDLTRFDAIQLIWPVQANELFITLPKALVQHLHEKGAEFYEWPSHVLPATTVLRDDQVVARLVTSFITQDQQREAFCNAIATFTPLR